MFVYARALLRTLVCVCIVHCRHALFVCVCERLFGSLFW